MKLSDLMTAKQAQNIIDYIEDLEIKVHELTLRLENAENEIQNLKAEYREDKWQNTYAQLGLYKDLEGLH